MTWAALIPLIVQYGLPLALKLAEKWESKDAVTPEELKELQTLAAQTPETQLRDALLRNGIDPASEKGVSLLNLVKSGTVAVVPPPQPS